MLHRSNRIRAAAEFSAVRRDGRAAGSALVGAGVRFREDSTSAPVRIGFVVSKRVGKATVRNTVKRRLRFAARAFLSDFAGWDLVITARPSAATATYADLADAMHAAVRRAVGRRDARHAEANGP